MIAPNTASCICVHCHGFRVRLVPPPISVYVIAEFLYGRKRAKGNIIVEDLSAIPVHPEIPARLWSLTGSGFTHIPVSIKP
jgi:hypothetical protein